ncbi:hypothetical protein MMC10_010368 [Thelotrema lepadinum]|nr:hypothetical protein [Thelotrema lepadinum]
MAGIRQGESLQDARKRYRTDAKKMLQEGYTNYKRKPFYVPTLEGDKLMVPPHFVDELKNLPDEQTDAAEPVFQAFESRYTLLASRELLHRRTIRNHLYQNIDSQKEDLLDETRASIRDTVGPCQAWTEVSIAECMIQTIARVSMRALGGLELSRNQAWIKATIGSTDDAVLGAQRIKVWPSLLKPLVARYIPEISRCKQHYEDARKIIVPILEAREHIPELQRPNDFLTWMTDEAKGSEKDKTFLADMTLNISFTALFTSTAAVLQLLYDLCSMPEYIEPLREEIRSIQEQYGKLDRVAIGQLYKLDSFMKESQRFNPLVLVTFTRWIWKDIRVGDFLIPASTNIGCPAQAMLMDSDMYPDPSRFDGFRFSKLRSQPNLDPAESASLQWAAATLNNMPFGYGRVSCPGRQFASMEIKMIVIELLMQYDFAPLEHRPESLCHDANVLPDRSVKLSMRMRAPE